MDTSPTADAAQLHWVQPRASERQFELRSQEGVVASLRFEKACGSLATAGSHAGSWTFKRAGFLNPRVTIRLAGANPDLGVFWPRFAGGGWLDLANGGRFHWKSTNLWSSEWGFLNAREEPLFVLRLGGGRQKPPDLLKTQASIEIMPRGQGLPELPLLMALAWYLTILQKEDATVAIIAATSAACS